ncbi:MAG: ankyrin repeat domain-containing protein [bacterium]
MKSLILIIFTAVLFSLIAAINTSAQDIFNVIKKGDLLQVKTIIEKDLKLLETLDEAGNTPLNIAIENNKNDIVLYLINSGCDVNAKSNKKETPLHIAARVGNKDIITRLVSKGALVNVNDAANYTPLTNAVRFKYLETVKTLVENGANINQKGMWNWLPIQLAAEFDQKEIVEYLIDKGSEIPIEPGQDSYQILNASCSKGLTKLFDKLLEKGYDLQSNRYTQNLLHLASAGGSEKIVNVLLSKGFKVMVGDGYGWSPLHSAAEKGNLEVVKLLLNNGADINDRSASGTTPYNLAEYFGNTEVCNFLISKGADTAGQQFPVLTGNYYGQKEPELKAKVFAPDIVTTKYAIHGNIVFSPKGDEAFWSGWYPSKNSTEEKQQILTAIIENGKWTKPQRASFSQVGFEDDCPFISPDGSKLFFVSKRPINPDEEKSAKENIWYVTKEGDNWGNPKPLDVVNSLILHWQVSVDKTGNLYFEARDPEGKNFGEIFCSKYINGEYNKPEKLSEKINSSNYEGCPYISPEGDYILFDRGSQQGMQMGLYISFLKKDGSWTEAKSITEAAKIDPGAQCCYVTQDGKYLFYIGGYTNEFGVFWVKTDFINEMKQNEQL